MTIMLRGVRLCRTHCQHKIDSPSLIKKYTDTMMVENSKVTQTSLQTAQVFVILLSIDNRDK